MVRRFALSLCAGLLLAPALATALPLEQVIEHAKGSVVHLSIRDAGGEIGSGTGFVVSADGKLVTNYHVVDGAASMVAVFGGGKEVPIQGAWLYDADKDLAILQLASGRYPSLSLAPESPKQGAAVIVIGSPRGLEGSVSTGIVSAVREKGLVDRDLGAVEESWGLQITAPISPGSSGSPVLDGEGRVVGVAVGERLHGQALNFAVPGSLLQQLLKDAKRVKGLEPLPEVHAGRSTRTNLMISAAFLAVASIVWWIVGRRAESKQKKKRLVGLEL